jgi:hypothetical protein
MRVCGCAGHRQQQWWWQQRGQDEGFGGGVTTAAAAMLTPAAATPRAPPPRAQHSHEQYVEQHRLHRVDADEVGQRLVVDDEGVDGQEEQEPVWWLMRMRCGVVCGVQVWRVSGRARVAAAAGVLAAHYHVLQDEGVTAAACCCSVLLHAAAACCCSEHAPHTATDKTHGAKGTPL